MNFNNKSLSIALAIAVLIQPFAPLTAFASGPVVGEAFTFTATGATSWSVPLGVTSVKVKAWGAGGAGGTGEKITDAHRSGLGGGAGAYVEKTIVVHPGDSYSITVGAGGQDIDMNNGRTGNPGGDTRFEGNSTTLVAGGGHGGTSFAGHGNPTGDLGVGGIAQGGDVNSNGLNADPYIEVDGNPYASKGGNSPNGGTGGDRGRCGRDGTCPGSDPGSPLAKDGNFPGGGGGGSDVAQGGFGGNGQIVIEVAAIAPVANIAPTISAFDISAASANLGDTMSWSGSASKGSSNITHYRAFVVGSNDGRGSDWMDATDPNSASFSNPAVSVELNPHSFFKGAGEYKLRFEVKDANNEVGFSEKNFTVNAAPSGGGGGTNPVVKPTISQFLITPTSLNQGQTMSWSGSATKGSSDIRRYRAFIVDSSVEAWTEATDPNTVSFSDSAISTLTNPRSFYHGVGDYTARFEVEDVNGQVASAERSIMLLPALVAGGPTISSFILTASSVVQGQTFGWSGAAAKGSSDIRRYRAFVVGSSIEAWTEATNPNAVSFSDSAISTLTNPRSFYHGVGDYTLRFEVEDVNGGFAAMQKPFTVTSPVVVPGAPVINSFSVSPNPVTQGQTMIWTGSAVRGTLPLSQYRAFVIGSNAGQGSAWTDVTDPNTVSFTNSSVATLTNPASFFHGPGDYTIRFEVKDSSGTSTVRDIGIVLNPAATTSPYSFILSATSGSTSENGGTVPVAITLSSAPIANVTLGIISSNFNEGTTSVRSLVFTPANWNVAQTAIITGIDDAVVDGPVAYTVTVGPSASTDVNWNNLPTQTISLINTDNDTAAVVVPPGGGGGTGGGGGGGSSSGGGSSLVGGSSYTGPCVGNCPSSVVGGGSPVVPGDVWILIDSQPTGSTGGGTVASPGPTAPRLVCPSVNFITRFLRIGADNDANEVSKLQTFLNTYEGANLAVDGVFGTTTEEAVKAFQVKYSSDVLAPWGVTLPTGIVYITTSDKINSIYCGDHPDYNGNVLDNNTAPDNSGQFDGVIGQATSTSSNIAGVFGAFTGRIFDALKGIPIYQLLILLLLLLGVGFTIQGTYKKDIRSQEAYLAFIKAISVISVASVLNVLNTMSFMLNPGWTASKTGLTLNWILGLDMANAIAVVIICISLLVALYAKIVKDKTPVIK